MRQTGQHHMKEKAPPPPNYPSNVPLLSASIGASSLQQRPLPLLPPHIHPLPPGTVGKDLAKRPKGHGGRRVCESRLISPSKGCGPLGSRGPLGPTTPEVWRRDWTPLLWQDSSSNEWLGWRRSDPLGLGGKREMHQSFSFINHLWISLVFVLRPAIVSI